MDTKEFAESIVALKTEEDEALRPLQDKIQYFLGEIKWCESAIKQVRDGFTPQYEKLMSQFVGRKF